MLVHLCGLTVSVLVNPKIAIVLVTFCSVVQRRHTCRYVLGKACILCFTRSHKRRPRTTTLPTARKRGHSTRRSCAAVSTRRSTFARCKHLANHSFAVVGKFLHHLIAGAGPTGREHTIRNLVHDD